MSLTLNTDNSLAATGAFASLDPLSAMDKRDRILLVDDSSTVRKMFSIFLSPRYECVEAGSFDEAMSELRKSTFSVVVTDIIMPGMSGIELLRKVLEDYLDTSVIIASGVDRPQRALDAIRLGAFDYLIKPCEPDVLQITVERALEHRYLVRNARRHKLEMETWNAELVSGKLQLERLQTQIVQNAKMAALGQLAAGVAHELNNPVGFVHANLEILDTFVQDLIRLVTFYDSAQISPSDESDALLIKKEIRYPAILEEISSIIKDCREGADRIRDISLNLRTFSRLDEAEFKETDIHEGLDATIRMASQYFSGEHYETTKKQHLLTDENERLESRIQLTVDSCVAVLREMITHKNSNLSEHCRRTSHYAALIGEQFGFGTKEMKELVLASILHEVPNIRMPFEMAFTKTALTPDQHRATRNNYEKGLRLISSVPDLEDVAAIIRYQHEHFDGTGFFDGLEGDKIPLHSRILAVANAFDDISSGRNPALLCTDEEAADWLRKRSGGEFDPHVVEVCLAAKMTEPVVFHAAARTTTPLVSASAMGI